MTALIQSDRRSATFPENSISLATPVTIEMRLSLLPGRLPLVQIKPRSGLPAQRSLDLAPGVPASDHRLDHRAEAILVLKQE